MRADALRAATVGGALLRGATVLAIILASTPARDWYERPCLWRVLRRKLTSPRRRC
ncbi:MAG: hypothetical protein ACLQFR_10930 [Streptosporangiaceae bacterium]